MNDPAPTSHGIIASCSVTRGGSCLSPRPRGMYGVPERRRDPHCAVWDSLVTLGARSSGSGSAARLGTVRAQAPRPSLCLEREVLMSIQLTPAKAAILLGTSDSTVRSLIRRGILPATPVGSRSGSRQGPARYKITLQDLHTSGLPVDLARLPLLASIHREAKALNRSKPHSGQRPRCFRPFETSLHGYARSARI
jgi:excisionase family DNA binding protein